MRHLRSRLRAEDGSALMISFFILLAVLAFSAASFEASTILSNATNRESNAQQAFHAADSGIDAAVHRLALLSPAATSCITNVTTATCPSGWGAATTTEAVGSGASFTYRVSTASPAPAGCVGSAQTLAADRCIVATGTSNGVQRRLMARVTTQGGTNEQLFSEGGGKAVDSVKIESGVSITSNVLLNNKLEVSHNSTITGTVTVGPRAKVKGWTTYSCYNPVAGTTDVPPNCKNIPVPQKDPQFGTTSTPYDAASNLGGHNNSTISTAYYTAGTQNQNGHRSLIVPKNKQVTLAPGTYNFCSINIQGRGILNTAGTAAYPVKIYLDSPYRTTGQPSYCPKNSGTFTAGGKSVIVNPSLDPTALQIFAFGSGTRKKRSRLQIPLGKTGNLAAIVIAPNSEIRFGDNKGVFIGGLFGRRIVFKKNMRFISDSRVTNWTTSTIVQSFRVAWKQCDSTLVNPTTPTQGC